MSQGARDGRRRVVGVMSGTSLDGVDCVLVDCVDGGVPRYVRHWSRRFPEALRSRLMAAAAGGGEGAWEVAQLHHDLGRFYARAVVSGLEGERPWAVGLHGQTVYHRPHPVAPATFQIGEPAYLAEALRVPVVANFRAADLAAGGEGAPLATLFHARVFGRSGAHVAVQNLGGIGNVTSIDARRRGVPAVRAFDTGPANMLLDLAAARVSGGRARMDRDGRLARRGRVMEALVTQWLRHPFVRRRPPKSTGREEFGAAFLDRCWEAMDAAGSGGRAEDRLATLAEFTVQSIALNYRRHLPGMPTRVVLCGGGAKNRHLLGRLRAILGAKGEVKVGTCVDEGWPVEAIEGGAFGFLAFERLSGRSGNVPATTGAARSVACGQVAAG